MKKIHEVMWVPALMSLVLMVVGLFNGGNAEKAMLAVLGAVGFFGFLLVAMVMKLCIAASEIRSQAIQPMELKKSVTARKLVRDGKLPPMEGIITQLPPKGKAYIQ